MSRTRLLMLAAVLAGVGLFSWFVGTGSSPGRSTGAGEADRGPGSPAWTFADLPRASSGEGVLRGRVVSSEGPVVGASVLALVAGSGEALEKIPWDGSWCGSSLLACDAPLAARTLEGLARSRFGQATLAGEAVTDAAGRFELTGLQVLGLNLWVSHPREGVAFVESVLPGEEAIEAELGPGRRITGLAFDGTGRPAGDARVTLIVPRARLYLEQEVGATGAFDLGRIPVAEATLVAWSEGFVPDHEPLHPPDGLPRTLTLGRARRVTGRVLLRGRPVVGAEVEILERDREHGSFNPRVQVLTDEEGVFQVDDLPVGSFVARAKQEWFLDDVRFDVRDEDEEVSVELRLKEGCGLEVIVRGPGGDPVPEARVEAEEVGTPVHHLVSAETDAEGLARLGPFLSSSHSITVSASGLVSGGVGGVYPCEGDPLRLGVQLRAALQLRGRVLDPEGQGVAGASVIVSWDYSDEVFEDGDESWKETDEGTSLSRSVQEEFFVDTDGAGHFLVEGIAPGPYLLQVRAEAFLELREEVRIPTEAVEVVLARGGRVAGRVVDEAGGAVVAAKIELEQRFGEGVSGYAFLGSVRSGDDGAFVFPAVPDGGFALRADRSGSRSRWSGWIQERTVEVRGGVGPTDLEIVLEKGQAIAGRVVDSSGRGIEEVKIVLGPNLEADGKPISWKERSLPSPVVATDAAGGFRFDGLAPGSHRLLASGKKGIDHPSSTTRARTGDLEVEIVLHRFPVLRGRVASAEGEPITVFRVAGVRVWDHQGRFSLPIDFEGTRKILIEAENRGSVTLEARAEVGEDIDLGRIVLDGGRRLSGTVVAAGTGEPVAGAKIEAWVLVEDRQGIPIYSKTRLHRSSSLRSTPAGTFVLEHMPAETYGVSVGHPDFAPKGAKVPPGQSRIEIALPTGGVIEGRVAEPPDPPASLKVSVSALKGGGYDAKVQEDGSFRFDNLRSGTYLVYVVSTGREPRYTQAEVAVVEGETIRVVLHPLREGQDLIVRAVASAEEVEEWEGLLFRLAAGEVADPRRPGSAPLHSAYRSPKDCRFGEDVILASIPPGRYTLLTHALKTSEQAWYVTMSPVEVGESGEQVVVVSFPGSAVRLWRFSRDLIK